MMDLTIDEKMLILLYSPGTRMGLYGALQQMKEQLEEDETELLDLTNSVFRCTGKAHRPHKTGGWQST